MSLRYSFLLLFTAACDGGNSGDTDSGNDVAPRERSYFVNTVAAPTSDCGDPEDPENVDYDNCVASAFTCNGTAPPTPDPLKQVNVTFNGEIHDFQSGDTVPEATANFWYGDDINGTMDATVEADKDGGFSTTLPTCTPIAYGTTTPADWELTVDTYEVHQVYGAEEDEVIDGEYINSVSQQTSKLIPGIIGIQWDQTTGIIAGTAFDCNENAIGNAQVFIHGADGLPPATGEIFYFDGGDLPTDHEHATATNGENGLWVAVNIPVGVWTAEMYTFNGTDYDLLGSTELDIKAGSVNISNVYTGHSDGIAYPASCLAI